MSMYIIHQENDHNNDTNKMMSKFINKLSYYMQMNETALHIAAKKGDTNILTVLLKHNPNLHVLDIVR